MHFIEIRIAGTEYRFESDDLDHFKKVAKLLITWVETAKPESLED